MSPDGPCPSATEAPGGRGAGHETKPASRSRGCSDGRRIRDRHNLVSVSGGKTAPGSCLSPLSAQAENISGVFCDTGNEHQQTYEYVAYLQDTTGIQIKTLKQDFTDWWWRRRDYVRDKWPEKWWPRMIFARRSG